MNPQPSRISLITGATSGLGLEAAAQLAASNTGTVIITGRDHDRAEAARTAIGARASSRAVVKTEVVDLAVSASVDEMVSRLADNNVRIDFLLLNAGMIPGSKRILTAEGIDETFAPVVGHHRLTMGLLDFGLLNQDARIVISGSEAARGDVPMMSLTDLSSLAESNFGGDLAEAAVALIIGKAPEKFKSNDTYANAKLLVSWWAAALARRLPAGTTVNSVSPGATPTTNAARNKGFMMRRVMMPMMAMMPKFMNMSASIEVGAARYLEASEFPSEANGQFYASAPKKMSGDLQRMDYAHVNDFDTQEAAWRAMVSVTGVGDGLMAKPSETG